MVVLLIVILCMLAGFAVQEWRASGRAKSQEDPTEAKWEAALEEMDDKLLERQQALSEARCQAVEAETRNALTQFELAKANMEIRVDVSGGVVQGVTNIPIGVTVKVCDYDTDGADGDDVEIDDDGDVFYPCVYAHDEA